jgi:septum formation protein
MTPVRMKLVLGSSSPYRRELLQRIIPNFECLSPAIDETPLADEAPDVLALRLARAKAVAVGTLRRDCLIIGSDQVAATGTHLLGKPGGYERAREQLQLCSGREVIFYTAVSVSQGADEIHSHIDKTTVSFRKLTLAEIDAYLDIDQPWDCAGSFKSEGLGVSLFESIQSNDPNALIGLPLIWLTSVLRQAGLDPLTRSAN